MPLGRTCGWLRGYSSCQKKTLAPGHLSPSSPAVVAVPLLSNNSEGEDDTPPLFLFTRRGRASGSRKGSAPCLLLRGGVMAVVVERRIGAAVQHRGQRRSMPNLGRKGCSCYARCCHGRLILLYPAALLAVLIVSVAPGLPPLSASSGGSNGGGRPDAWGSLAWFGIKVAVLGFQLTTR
jgi:hypothetical protein